MANVSVLRLDLGGGCAPGNKRFKLRDNLIEARSRGARCLISFGGAWSNHLHALAATGHELGMKTVGVVRGELSAPPTPTLQDALDWGMELLPVSRTEYRQRHQSDYQRSLLSRYSDSYLIPEGGANAAGVQGCVAIGQAIRDCTDISSRQVVLPVGTGATLAGVALGLGRGYEVVGVSALKGADDLAQRVTQSLTPGEHLEAASWQILHEHHCGGFARTSAGLREFMLEFESVQGIPLEPVYTGKTLYAVYQLLRSGQWDSQRPLLVIHTGGLQGRRGYPWLEGLLGEQ
jgi:1-aminocyclopropane-1-carboxylate deaminase/D-cysteine desulfhydrase-like pyridoxal-dependent ACC family enzyme